MIDHEYHALEFEITLDEDLGAYDEDQGAAEGLVYGLAAGLGFWLVVVCLWRFPGLRWPVYKLAATAAFLGASLFAVHLMSRAIQRRHPKSGTVEWFRRNGLL